MNFAKLFTSYIKNNTYRQIFYRRKQIYSYKSYISPLINCESKRLKLFCDRNHYLKCHKRDFRLTRPNQALSPILWMVIRSILTLFTMLTGRALRIWWSKLPPSMKQQIIFTIREKRLNIWLGSILFGGVVSVYYVSHLVEDPVTKRKKFLLFSERQIVHIANMESDFILKKLNKRISKSGDNYEKVLKISQRILKANKHFPGVQKKWEVFIINDIEKRNAFVLPSGHIFIFTGMLNILSNDDQIAVMLSHEMAHALLNHSAEVISETHLLELLMLLPILVIWTLLPDFIAISSHVLLIMINAVLFRLPMNRRIEIEADVVGLSMVARSCYDPRQATVFWKRMEDLGQNEGLEWLSTHPSFKTRYEIMRKRMPQAITLRNQYCSRSDLDPRN